MSKVSWPVRTSRGQQPPARAVLSMLCLGLSGETYGGQWAAEAVWLGEEGTTREGILE